MIIKADYIRDTLSYIKAKVEDDSKQYLYDINKSAEDIFMHILNVTYGYDLKNANDIKPNFPTIDLLDTTKKIAIQVTSDTSKKKVKTDTVEAFKELVKQDEFKEYSGYTIKMFYIKNKPSNATLKNWDEKFISQSNILGIEDINTKVSTNPTIATKVFKTLCEIFHDKVCDSDISPNLTIKESTRDSSFIGREDELNAIDEMLESSNSLLLINGIGGIGKSTLANHYLYTREKNFDYYGFIDGLDSFTSEFKNSLDLKAEKEEDIYYEIISKLQKLQGKKLLVIDNVEDIEKHKKLIEMILSLHKYDYKILLTSRRKIKQVISYPLGTLLPIDAQKLFLNYYKSDELEKVDRIINDLGFHTLFIKLVAETIENEGYTLDDIIDKFENGELSKIEFIDEESGDELTFNQNLQELFSMQNLKDEYVLLLKRLSVLPSIDIELSFLEEILGKERLKGRLNFLVGRGWLIENGGSYKLHQIIKEYIFSTHLANFEEIESILDYYLTLMDNADNPQVAINNRDKLQFFDAFVDGLKRVGTENKKVANYFNNLGLIYSYLGKYDKAEPLYEKALEIKEKILGEEHSNTAGSYNNLASLYMSKGKYNKAEPLHKKALEIHKKVLGEENHTTATSYNNLAELYRLKGISKEAELLYKKALEIQEKVLGEEHPNTAQSYNNLALLYYSKEAYDKAEALYKKALETREKVLGKEHPDTAQSYNNLALLYYSKEAYDEAEPLYKKALETREKVLGKEHPDTAGSYNNLALLYYSKGEYDEAEPLYKEALKIQKKVLGEEHPDTATSYNNLASLYDSKEAYDKAEPLYKKTLEIREKVLGEEHPYTATSYRHLGLFYKERKLCAEAKEYLKKAIGTVEKLKYPHISLIELKRDLKSVNDSIKKEKKLKFNKKGRFCADIK